MKEVREKTVFFNLFKLEELAGSDYIKFMTLLKRHTYNTLPSKWDKYKLPLGTNLHGTSFILKPNRLFQENVIDIIYRVQYVKLAARRDYSHYKTYGSKSLIRSYFPDLNISLISHNPLLTITDREILFKFEEN